MEMELLVLDRRAGRLALALGDVGELFGRCGDRPEIDRRIVPPPPEIPRHQFGRWMRGSVGEGRGRGVDDFDALLDRLPQNVRRAAGGGVPMEIGSASCREREGQYGEI